MIIIHGVLHSRNRISHGGLSAKSCAHIPHAILTHLISYQLLLTLFLRRGVETRIKKEGQLPKVAEVVRGELRISTCATSNLGIFVKSKNESGVQRVVAFSFHSPRQPGQQRPPSPSHHPSVLPLVIHPLSLCWPKPWDSFLLLRERER